MEPELLSPRGKYATVRTIDRKEEDSIIQKQSSLIHSDWTGFGRNHTPIQTTQEDFLALKANVEADCLLSFVAEIKKPLDLYLHFLILLRNIAFN